MIALNIDRTSTTVHPLLSLFADKLEVVDTQLASKIEWNIITEIRGYTNTVYVLPDGLLFKVFFPDADDQLGDLSRGTREHTALSLLKTSGVVPELVVGLKLDGGIQGVLMRRVGGCPLSQISLPLTRKAELLAIALRKAHDASAKILKGRTNDFGGLDGPLTALDWLVRGKDSFQTAMSLQPGSLAAVRDADEQVRFLYRSFSEIRERLENDLTKEVEKPTIVHGDLNLSNILFDEASPSSDQTAVLIDWEYCTTASIELDLAVLFSYCPEFRNSANQKVMLDAMRSRGFRIESSMLNQYLLVAHWLNLYYLLRMAKTAMHVASEPIAENGEIANRRTHGVSEVQSRELETGSQYYVREIGRNLRRAQE